jgi:hypothetical protein
LNFILSVPTHPERVTNSVFERPTCCPSHWLGIISIPKCMGNELGTWEHVGEQIGNLGIVLGRDLIS